MSEIIERGGAVTRPSRGAHAAAKDRAISLNMSLAKIKHLLADYPRPQRPNRNRPLHLPDPELRGELEAWDAASDEALQAMEDDLPE